MRNLQHMAIMAIVTAMVIQVTGCGTSRTMSGTRAEGSEQAEEEDILRLLGVEGETGGAPSRSTPEQMASRIAGLESELMAKESEINELKAELVLKDERIEELTARLGGAGGPAPSQPSMAPRNFREFEAEYQRTLGLYQTGRYREAIERFQQLLAVDMDNSLSDNCQYWIGECYYALKDFRQSVVEFEKVFTFSNSNKDDDAQLKLGLCYVNLRDLERARAEFNRLLTNYPDSEYVSRARSYLAQL